MFALRGYQQKVVDDVIREIKRGNTKILIQLGTGGGKTAIASNIAKGASDKGNGSFFICHRREIVDQTFKTYLANELEASFIMGGRSVNLENNIQIANIATLVNRLDKYKKPRIIIWDECHHLAASNWTRVFDAYPDAIHIGLTATPCRLDGKPLNTFFEIMVKGPTLRKLMDEGYLVNYEYFAPSKIDLKKLTKGKGDYTKKSLETADFRGKLIGDNITHYKKMAMGKRNVIFAVSIKHSKEIVQRYKDEGIPAAHLDGDVLAKERRETIEKFDKGEILILSNVDLFGEGFDLPNIEVVSLLRPTQSLSLYMQMVGRGLRTVYSQGFDLSTKEGRLNAILHSDKQKLLILDHANNYDQHGMPDDDRIWTLSKEKPRNVTREKNEGVPMKRCPECFYAHDPALVCPNCGHTYEADGRTVKEIAGELVLIGSRQEKEAKKQEIIIADCLLDLVIIEKERGYAHGWAEINWDEKTGTRLRDTLEGYETIAKARNYKDTWAWAQWKRRKNK